MIVVLRPLCGTASTAVAATKGGCAGWATSSRATGGTAVAAVGTPRVGMCFTAPLPAPALDGTAATAVAATKSGFAGCAGRAAGSRATGGTDVAAVVAPRVGVLFTAPLQIPALVVTAATAVAATKDGCASCAGRATGSEATGGTTVAAVIAS